LYYEILWRNQIDNICESLFEGVPNYHNQIQRGEERIKNRQEKSDILTEKVQSYLDEGLDPFDSLEVDYPIGVPKSLFSPDEDRFLICMTSEIGYGNWELLQKEIRKYCRFDFFIKSRSTIDLQKRVDRLIVLLTREKQRMIEIAAEKKREERKKKRQEKEKEKKTTLIKRSRKGKWIKCE